MQASIFIDGMNAGTSLNDRGTNNDTGMSVNTRVNLVEGKAIRKLMKKAKAEYSKGDWVLEVPGNSASLFLTLRLLDGNPFLNLSGNPLTFFHASNVFGFKGADKQIVRCFKHAIRYLERRADEKLPKRVKEIIDEGEINIHSLEFAAYTKELDKKRYLSAIQHVYGAGARTDKLRRSIPSMLKIKITQNYDNETVGIAFPYGGSYEKKLLIYDKEAEMLNKGEDPPPFLDSRLRYDISLDPEWFRRRKIRTVRQLSAYIETHGGEERVVANEIQDCIDRACLEYMFKIDAASLLEWEATNECPVNLNSRLDYDCHLTMWYALQTDVQQSVKSACLRGDFNPLLSHMQGVKPWMPKLGVER